MRRKITNRAVVYVVLENFESLLLIAPLSIAVLVRSHFRLTGCGEHLDLVGAAGIPLVGDDVAVLCFALWLSSLLSIPILRSIALGSSLD